MNTHQLRIFCCCRRRVNVSLLMCPVQIFATMLNYNYLFTKY